MNVIKLKTNKREKEASREGDVERESVDMMKQSLHLTTSVARVAADAGTPTID